MKRLSLSYLLLLCLCFVSGAVLAQSVSGALVGLVTDPSGAAVSNAKVSVRNVGTNQMVEGTTTKDGIYSVPNLQPADYDVTITAPGFSTANIAHVHLLVSASIRNDVKLTVGTAESKVEVSASPTSITTDDSTIGDVLEGTAIARLPLNGRTIDRALVFVAGNTNDNADNPQISGGLHWNGAMYTVDGVPVNDISNGAAAYSYDSNLTTLPSTEIVQEIKVTSSVAKAEFEGGSAISITTKSGANKFHGEAYYFNRNRFGAARDYFAYAGTVVKPGLNRNEFGGFISGPIWKDKTFFLFATDFLIQRNGKPNFFTVPTDAERTGNFSGTTKQLWNASTGTIIPGNQITNIDPRAAALLAYIPHANIASSGASASGGPTNNLLQTVNNKYDDFKYTGKLDHNLNRLNALTAEGYYAYGNPYFSRNGTPAQYGNYQNAGYITIEGMLRDVSVFSPRMLNDIHYSYFSHRNIRLGQNASFDPTTLFPALYGPFRIGGLSTVNMTNYTAVGDTGGAGHNPETTQSVADNFTLVRGRHTMKFGASVNFNNVIIKSGTTSSSLGTFGFTGRFTASAPGTPTSDPTYNATGDAFADFLLGSPNSTVRATPQIAINQTYQNYQFFGQDDWAVTPRLTLNVGLRYEVQTTPNEQNGDFSNFDFSTGKLVIRSSGGVISKDANATVLALYPGTYTTSEANGWGSSVVLTDKTDYGPRVGFAYRLTADAKTVLRGGYGIYYGLIPPGIGPIRISQLNFPFLLTQSYTSTSAYAPTLSLANPFPGTGTVAANPTIYASQRDSKQAHIQQWNLTLEQALPAATGFRISYVGNKTTHAPYYVFDENFPVTQRPLTSLQAGRRFQPWASILTNLTEGYAFTNQMQAELTKRTGNGLYLQTSYTWSSGLDNVPISGTTQNPYNLGGDKGNSDGTRKNNFFLQATYDLPFHRHGFGERVVNGWSLASLTQLRSGTPFSPSFTIPSTTTNASGGVALGTSTTGWYATRPNKVAGKDPYALHSQHGRYFDASAFVAPDNFTFGNAGRNSLIGPPEVGFDLSLEKKTTLYEGAQLLLRLDAFNALNHPNFGNPSANISNTSSAGLITATNGNQPNRSLQLGGKFVF
jgi:hypothetical protein